MTKPENSRRKKPSKSEQELYQLSNIQSFIKTERRHDELSRLKEVQEQKNIWRNTLIYCGLLNLTLIVLAVIGLLK